MEVLRRNKSTIITILEVLLYDPLHMWTLTQKEASKRQDVQVWCTEEGSMSFFFLKIKCFVD